MLPEAPPGRFLDHANGGGEEQVRLGLVAGLRWPDLAPPPIQDWMSALLLEEHHDAHDALGVGSIFREESFPLVLPPPTEDGLPRPPPPQPEKKQKAETERTARPANNALLYVTQRGGWQALPPR